MTEIISPCLAVIIPHFDDSIRLERCLSALSAQDLAGIEVVVVDNGTPGGLELQRAEFSQVRFVYEGQRGAAAARNCGVNVSTAPWLVFLDADCVPCTGWLDRARAIASADPSVVTGGRIKVFDETAPPRSGAEGFEAVFAFDQERYIKKAGFSVTANLVAARSVFEAAGPMIVGLSEDVDWCHRATGAGAALRYDPHLVVAHPSRSDWASLSRKWRRTTAEGFQYESRRAGGRVRWLIKALMMPASILVHLPRVLRHPTLTPLEKFRTVGTLARLRLARMAWMLRQLVGGGP